MADLVIRTKAGKTLRQAALEIKNYIKKSSVLGNGDPSGKLEDMLGEVMVPPVKSSITAPTGRWYTRIRITDQDDIDAVAAALPLATTVELVGWDIDVEVDPGVWLTNFA